MITIIYAKDVNLHGKQGEGLKEIVYYEKLKTFIKENKNEKK